MMDMLEGTKNARHVLGSKNEQFTLVVDVWTIFVTVCMLEKVVIGVSDSWSNYFSKKLL